MGDVELNPPKERRCVKCGRVDVWDEEIGDWTVKEEDEELFDGDRFCLHEWDITGSHTPIRERT